MTRNYFRTTNLPAV